MRVVQRVETSPDVLDVWFEQKVKPRLRGSGFLERYADDFVMGFVCEEDSRRVLEVLPKRSVSTA